MIKTAKDEGIKDISLLADPADEGTNDLLLKAGFEKGEIKDNERPYKISII